MEKFLIKRVYDLVIIVSYVSASDFSNKWMLDQDFENNLDTSQLLWDKEGISSLLTCGSLCNSNPSCRSFFYHPSLKKCLGSQSYKRGLPSGQSMQLGWKYYTTAAGALSMPFIGLRKTLSNDNTTWKWWNGQEASYLKWATGEPNSQGGTEDCVNFHYAEYMYNDERCWYPRPFICHKQI